MTVSFQLTTARLILKPVRLEDFDSWAAMMADAEATRFLGGPKSRFAAWLMFRDFGSGWYFDGYAGFSIFEKASGNWVGYSGILRRDWLSEPESIAGIIKDRWRYGYVMEASSAVFDWAFEQLGFAEVISCIAPDHAVSKGTARKQGAEYRGQILLPTIVPNQEFLAEVWVFNRERWLARPRDDPPDFFAAPRA